MKNSEKHLFCQFPTGNWLIRYPFFLWILIHYVKPVITTLWTLKNMAFNSQ
jgi:hypothetical protein